MHLKLITNMLIEEKSMRLGKVFAGLRKANEELQARVVPQTPPEQVEEGNEAIEDASIEIIELENKTQIIAEDITKFWGNLVQDD